MLQGHLNILGHFWQCLTSLDNHQKSLEVVGTFLEILDIKGENFTHLTQEKFGKYRLWTVHSVNFQK